MEQKGLKGKRDVLRSKAKVKSENHKSVAENFKRKNRRLR